MTDYKVGDLVDEPALRRDLAAARARLDAADAEHETAREAWLAADKALSNGLAGRWPRENELTYALGATCKGCGAPLAYWDDTRPNAWVCADVLLGRVGTPKDKALIVERSIYVGDPPPAPPGKVLHEQYPFSCWSIKSDGQRKTREVPSPSESADK